MLAVERHLFAPYCIGVELAMSRRYLSSRTIKSPEQFTLSEWFTILGRNCGPDLW